MTTKERKELARDIKQRLDEELDFVLDYKISHYHEYGNSIVDVDFDIYDTDDCPEDWEEQVEDVISDVAGDWGGFYCWDGSCISVSIEDD